MALLEVGAAIFAALDGHGSNRCSSTAPGPMVVSRQCPRSLRRARFRFGPDGRLARVAAPRLCDGGIASGSALHATPALADEHPFRDAISCRGHRLHVGTRSRGLGGELAPPESSSTLSLGRY